MDDKLTIENVNNFISDTKLENAEVRYNTKTGTATIYGDYNGMQIVFTMRKG